LTSKQGQQTRPIEASGAAPCEDDRFINTCSTDRGDDTMKINKAMIAVAATMALAAFGTAGAATSAAQPAATQATCDALLKQADTAMAAHKGDPKAAAAKEQRAKGEAACKAGDFAKGSEHLRRAITDLGMKPVN
jgi:hypothetical protein